MGHSKVQNVVMLVHAGLYLGLVVYTIVFLREVRTITEQKPLSNLDLYVYTTETLDGVRMGSTILGQSEPCERVASMLCGKCCSNASSRNAVATEGYLCRVNSKVSSLSKSTDRSRDDVDINSEALLPAAGSLVIHWRPKGWPLVQPFYSFDQIMDIGQHYAFQQCYPPYADGAYPLLVHDKYDLFDVFVSKEESFSTTSYATRVYGSELPVTPLASQNSSDAHVVAINLLRGKLTLVLEELDYDVKELVYLSVLLLVTTLEIIYVTVSWCQERKPRKKGGYGRLKNQVTTSDSDSIESAVQV